MKIKLRNWISVICENKPWSYGIYKINGHSSYIQNWHRIFLQFLDIIVLKQIWIIKKKKKIENPTNLELFSAMGCTHGNNEKFTVVQVGAPVSAPSNK